MYLYVIPKCVLDFGANSEPVIHEIQDLAVLLVVGLLQAGDGFEHMFIRGAQSRYFQPCKCHIKSPIFRQSACEPIPISISWS